MKLACCLLYLVATLGQSVSAADVVKVTRPHSEKDQRHVYNQSLITMALEKTVRTHGSYRIELTLPPTQRKRALSEIVTGKNINVHTVATQPEWERQAIPIRIPVAKGLLGYRLFLINQSNQKTFDEIETLKQLKSLNAGLRQQWTITRIMEAQGFPVITGNNYEGLFGMLMRNRFDYFPRGVNEIYAELEQRKPDFPEMAIEEKLVVYIPTPIYIFVSPEFPELAERIETGLRVMLEDGSFDQLFWQYHGPSIERSRLEERRMFRVANPFLSPETPLANKQLWYDPTVVN